MLSQLVIICSIQNAHNMTLSTAVLDKFWIMLGHLICLFAVESFSLNLLRSIATDFGNLHPRRA